MRKLFAWLGVATLVVLFNGRADAGEPLKPFVVLVLDTSGSMATATDSGPPSCGGSDTRLDHARCAIRKIVNSYGDMVFALGKFRQAASGTTTANTFPSGCTSTGAGNSGTSTCNATSDMFELLTPLVNGNNDESDLWVNLTGNTCSAATPPGAGVDPEIFSANGNTPLAGSLNGSKLYWNGTTLTSPSNFSVWPSNLPGFAPIANDITRNTFFAKPNKPDSCDPNPATCDNSAACVAANTCCCAEQCRPYITILLTDGEETCAPSAVVPTFTANTPSATLAPLAPATTAIGDLVIVTTISTSTTTTAPTHALQTGFTAVAGTSSQTLVNTAISSRLSVAFKIATQAGAQSYQAFTATGAGASFSGIVVVPAGTYGSVTAINATMAAAANNNAAPNPPTSATSTGVDSAQLAIGAWQYAAATNTNATVQANHTLLSQIANSQLAELAFSNLTSTITAGNTNDPGSFGDDTTPTGTIGVTLLIPLNVPAVVAAAQLLGTDVANKRYVVQTKPIGFGITPGDANIEAIAHAGGAIDVPAVNEGFYASDEASLQLAISSILDDAIRTEICNNKDDDCDGEVDEDFKPALGTSCTNNALGQCLRSGNLECKLDGTGLQCNAATVICNASNRLIQNGVDIGPCGELCNNIDDDCDGKVDEGIVGCSCSPQQEQCNGRDDDCDGRIDEASTNGPKLTRPCGTGTCAGVETCNFAVFGPPNGDGFGGCTAQVATTETCNGLDDNCDGIKDGLQQGCSDMNPLPPENFAKDDPRNNPGDPSNNPIPENICHPGFKVCPVVANPPNSFGTCQNEVKPCNNNANNSPDSCQDLCNGLDDDCDNIIDEDFQSADCSNGCGIGTTKCTNGVLECESTAVPGGDNNCNGVDEDCDNKTDEGFACDDQTPKPGFPGSQGVPGTCDPHPATCDASPTCTDPANCCCACSCNGGPNTCAGEQICAGGQKTCQAEPAQQESCDCSDNNCNGKTDEGNLCAAGSICNEFCQCAFACAAGEFPCPLGKFCKEETQGCSSAASCDPSDACTQDPANTNCCCRSLCIADPCAGVTCDPVGDVKQVCQRNPAGNDHTCVPACDVAGCQDPLICIPQTGECKVNDCTTFPDRCANNQNCIAGVCVTNLCKDVTCPTDQYCAGGNCVNSCADVECPSGQRCRLGVCEADPCGSPCPFGQACNDNSGQCVPDGCPQITCPQGQYCNPNNNGGTCETDLCVGTTCPSPDQICKGGTCFDPEDLGPDGGIETKVTTGGGGGCQTGGGEAGLLLLGIALLFVRRRGGRS